MLKNISIISILILLSNCASPGSAFLGPVFTGAKTGSVYQASISYSSGRVINAIKDASDNVLVKKKLDDKKSIDEVSQPAILIAILTPSVEINDIFEEEPLP